MRTLKSVLVLGGAGFLGRWTVRTLLDRGIDVTCVDRDPRGRLASLPVRSIQADVSGSDRPTRELLRDGAFDAIFCLVGTGSVPRSLEHPSGDLANNVLPALAVLEELRDEPEPPLFLYASSAAVYGETIASPIGEDHPMAPVSPYGISKRTGESYTQYYAVNYGMPTLAVRPFSIYGPGQRKLVVHDLIRRLLDGEDPLQIDAPADVTRDLVFVGDVAEAMVAIALAAPADGSAVNISSGRETSLETLAGTLVDIVSPDASWRFSGNLRPGDPRRWVGDARLAESFGAACRTPLEAGLRQTVDWLRAA